MKAPETIETDRLRLRKPVLADAETIFSRYANDPEVTRFLSWPGHKSVEDTKSFLAFSDSAWEMWPAGPYLIEARGEGRLIGGTGLSFQTPPVAETGYVLARDAWGRGYATEALNAVVMVAAEVGVSRLLAFCHPANSPSTRVLEKCGFRRDDSARHVIKFPNSDENNLVECLSYSQRIGRSK